MEKKAALFLCMAFTALSLSAQAGGLIEGKGWAFLVSAPEGWVWDATTLRHQGVQGLFYKQGTKFSPSSLHMYITPTGKKAGEAAGFGDFIEADETMFMKTDPTNVVKDLAPYSSGVKYDFTIKDFDDPTEGFYQSIAYYDGEGAYFIFVLFCRSARERERERTAFLELLDSFTYISKE